MLIKMVAMYFVCNIFWYFCQKALWGGSEIGSSSHTLYITWSQLFSESYMQKRNIFGAILCLAFTFYYVLTERYWDKGESKFLESVLYFSLKEVATRVYGNC